MTADPESGRPPASARWRLAALIAAPIPTALTVVTGSHSGGYVGFTDRPVDPTDINLYFHWQTLVTMGAPAVIVALAWLCRGVAMQPAATVAAALLAVLAAVAVFGAITRGALPDPVPAAPRVVLWLYVPCFAASFVALLRCRSALPHEMTPGPERPVLRTDSGQAQRPDGRTGADHDPGMTSDPCRCAARRPYCRDPRRRPVDGRAVRCRRSAPPGRPEARGRR